MFDHRLNWIRRRWCITLWTNNQLRAHKFFWNYWIYLQEEMKTAILINKSKLDVFCLLLCKSESITLGTTYLCTMSVYISEEVPKKCFYKKAFLKTYSKFTGEHSCQSVVSINLQSKFIEITLRHGCSIYICCIFSEYSFMRTPMGGCLWYLFQITQVWVNR